MDGHNPARFTPHRMGRFKDHRRRAPRNLPWMPIRWNLMDADISPEKNRWFTQLDFKFFFPAGFFGGPELIQTFQGTDPNGLHRLIDPDDEKGPQMVGYWRCCNITASTRFLPCGKGFLQYPGAASLPLRSRPPHPQRTGRSCAGCEAGLPAGRSCGLNWNVGYSNTPQVAR